MGGRAPGAGGLRVRLASVGKDRSGLFSPGVEEYAARLRRYTRFELLELAEARGKRSAGSSREAEGKALLGRLGPSDWLVALDERGELWTSAELAAFLQRAQLQSRDLLFVIGGDEGLWPPLREQAHKVLSLSRMTLPHRLARLVLAEQLYRAHTLLRGEPYHR